MSPTPGSKTVASPVPSGATSLITPFPSAKNNLPETGLNPKAQAAPTLIWLRIVPSLGSISKMPLGTTADTQILPVNGSTARPLGSSELSPAPKRSQGPLTRTPFVSVSKKASKPRAPPASSSLT